MLGAAFAGATMFGVRTAVAQRPIPTEDMAAFEAAIVELIHLRRLLLRFSSALGSLVALSTLALGAATLLSDNQPREPVVVFGGAGSAAVGVFYAPAAAIRARGELLATAIFASTKPGDAVDLTDQLERRSKLDQLVGVDRTLFGDLRSAIPVLGPLIAASAVFLPK